MSYTIEVPSRSWIEPDTQATDADAVLAYLRANAGEFVTARDAARALGIGSGATEVRLRRAVRVLVYRGYPVESGVNGFRLSIDSAGIRRTIMQLRSRGDAAYARADALEKTLRGARS